VAVWIGLIALAGVAAEIGVVMLVYLDEAFERYGLEGWLSGRTDLLAAVREGADESVRPALMTAAAVIGGFLPIRCSGAGATVMKRIAAPMVGGMVSATVLTLLMVPALYLMGPEAGMASARACPRVGALFHEMRDGDVVPSWSPSMERWLDLASLPSHGRTPHAPRSSSVASRRSPARWSACASCATSSRRTRRCTASARRPRRSTA
jgi:Cu(I)/Ag(I) efflux system membrane protein CusA/SilA